MNTLSLDISPEPEQTSAALIRKSTILATVPKVLHSKREWRKIMKVRGKEQKTAAVGVGVPLPGRTAPGDSRVPHPESPPWTLI